MRSYISKILELNGRTYALPIPGKYRELLDCVSGLRIKKAEDEDGMKIVGYKALFVPEPDPHYMDSKEEVERVAEALSKLTEEQVRAVGQLCVAFALQFGDIMGVLCYIYPHLKEAENDEYKLYPFLREESYED
jgi:hypothetical protein